MENSNNTTNYVQITEEQKSRSKKLKKEKVRTIHQQQVFRDSQQLYLVLAQINKTCPVKYRPVVNPMYSECAGLLVSLSIAFADMYSRVPQLTIAAAHIDAIKAIVCIMKTLGCICNDDFKKIKSLVASCSLQVSSWRASSMVRLAQGSNSLSA